MCFPMFSPLVINKNVYYDDTLLGHTAVGNKVLPFPYKMLFSTEQGVGWFVHSCWKPEWDWIKRFSYKNIPAIDSQPPFWVTQSALKELNAVIAKFNNWEALYEMFRRTDNAVGEHCSSVHLAGINTGYFLPDTAILCDMAKRLIEPGALLMKGITPCVIIKANGDMEFDSERWWDVFWKNTKNNPENRIPVWRE